MTTDTASLAGPDLRVAGYAVAELADGAMVLGHADGEPVLVARRGEEWFAVSATCAHYGGPLAEGILVGETVRCPLHHACFSLRTGEALRAPALNPIACWDIEHRGPRLFVIGKRPERDPLAPTGQAMKPADAPSAVVIIGAGAAGSAAAEMLRRQGYQGSITMVDAEPESPYDRPNLSKDFLAGTAQEDWIPLRPADFYAQHGIEIVRNRAISIDPSKAEVALANGRPLRYGALLLATGAEPNRLDIPGATLPYVHVLRSLTDSKAIIEAAEQAKRAVVIGGSFIGLEAAASLRKRGIEVDVVALESVPLERVLGKDVGELIQRLHEGHGVTFHLSATASRIDARGVHLADGTSLPADLVVVGVGVRPRVEIASLAGLRVDRGVVVNQYLETSAAHIYAAGDIARWPDRHSGSTIRVEHWVVAQRQGQTVARNMLGAAEPFDAVPFFWSQHYDTAIRYTGHAERWDQTRVAGELMAGNASIAYESGGKTMAVASVGQDRANLEAEVALERG
jgi:NADPH-dependent 2,4-dienoyl-CoA reductase/sulfur reductase-like enzyme/nitrite reductase/ring-hydroxylating ferredoxin subunit